MSSGVLRGARPAAGRRTLSVPSGQALDPAVAEQIAAAREEGYAAGRRDGRREGEQAARARLDALGQTIAVALAAARGEVAALRADQARATTALARQVAEVVLAHEPSQGGVDALARIERALAELDDTELIVAVAPSDCEDVTAALGGTSTLTVVADPGLEEGEARIRGTHGAADLTREGVWAAVDRALDVTADADVGAAEPWGGEG